MAEDGLPKANRVVAPTEKLFAPDSPVDSQHQPYILIVDDDPAMLELSTRHLQAAGLRTRQALTAQDALTLASRVQPAFILCDFYMPGMNGDELCRTIRALPGGGEIPVTIVSAAYDFETANCAYEAGATEFMTKPSDFELLTHRIHHHIETACKLRLARQIEERFELIADVCRDGFWEWDIETNTMYYSRRWQEILDLEESLDAEPNEWWARVHPDDCERVQAEFNRQRRGDILHVELEHRLRGGDGSYRRVVARGKAMRFADGHAARIAGLLSLATAPE